MRSLSKTKKTKTEYDIKRLLSYVKDIDFFKERDIDDATLTQIVTTADFSFVAKGQWVFKEGDEGN